MQKLSSHLGLPPPEAETKTRGGMGTKLLSINSAQVELTPQQTNLPKSTIKKETIFEVWVGVGRHEESKLFIFISPL